MREFRVNCYPTAVKRESLSSTRERRVSARCGVARRRTAASREVNLAKAVIKLISYLEDARMYCTDRESSRFASHSLARFLFNGLNYQRLSTPLFAYRPLFSFLSVSFSPPSLSLSCSLSSLSALMSPSFFRLFIRFLLMEPVAVQSSDLDQCTIEFSHYRRPSPDETFAGPFYGRRRAGRPGFRERSKALWVIRSGIIFRRVLFQFINKDS